MDVTHHQGRVGRQKTRNHVSKYQWWQTRALNGDLLILLFYCFSTPELQLYVHLQSSCQVSVSSVGLAHNCRCLSTPPQRDRHLDLKCECMSASEPQVYVNSHPTERQTPYRAYNLLILNGMIRKSSSASIHG